MTLENGPQVVTKVYDFLLYIIPQVAKFPKSQRYLLGERIENISFDILEYFLQAFYSQNKLPILKQINTKLDQARHYIRLSKDLKFINLHQYEVVSKMVNDIGVQLGGWIRQQKQKS